MKVLFVCSGNICRSAMAAEYMRHRAADSGLSHLVVDSGGLLGIRGAPAAPESIEALAEAGLDLAAHRSKGLTLGDLLTSDLVLVMTTGHLRELERRYPGRGGEWRLLRAYEAGAEPDPDPLDLRDPIGEPLAFHRDCFRTIRTCVDHLALSLRHRR